VLAKSGQPLESDTLYQERPIVNDEFEEERIETAFRPRDGRFEVTDAAVRRDPEFIPNIFELWVSGKSSRADPRA
jgi:hypothetical protein